MLRRGTAPGGPGLHGKVPILGDFVSRGLPGAVLRPLEFWLQSWVLDARMLLGNDWRAAWNRTPVWHATFGASVLAAEPWAAVIIPSVDRVGRSYPFTVLAPLCGGDGALATTWHQHAEALALTALEDTFDADVLLQALRALQAPAGGTAVPIATGWSRPSADAASAMVPAGTSLWWSRPEPDHVLALHVAGLPTAEHAAGLTLGAPPDVAV